MEKNLPCSPVRLIGMVCYISLLSLILGGCAPSVWFEEPQPLGVKNTNSFERAFQGRYQSVKDGSILIVGKNRIYWTRDVHVKLHKRDMFPDTTIDVSNEDTLMAMLQKETRSAFIKNDTIYAMYQVDEVVFDLSDSDYVLRFYQNQGYLNQRFANLIWSVKMLSLQNDSTLIFTEIHAPEDIGKIEQVTAVKTIRNKKGKIYAYQLKPSREALLKLLQQEGICYDEIYMRIPPQVLIRE